MDVLRLLENKNRCLRRFLEQSALFLRSAEAGDFSEITQFEAKRGAILKALDLYDRKIAEVVSGLSAQDRSEKLISGINAKLTERDTIFQAIVNLDRKVFGIIENEKARLQKTLSHHEKSKILAKKFKSSWISESGEELDKKL